MKRQNESGAVLVMFALLITALLVIVAIVIDLGATRGDRRGGQLAVDTAAAAAGQGLIEGNAVTACEAAIDFLEATLDATFSGYDCSDLADCATATPVEAVAENYRATLYSPVPDDSPLMQQTSTIGARDGAFSSDRPGDPCDRFGVQLTTSGDAFFGGVAGSEGRQSTVHAVVLVTPPTDGDRLINLAVLHRTDCQTILTSGAGGSGVVARPITTSEGTFPGTISVDSNGDNCGSSNGTVDLGGANSLVRADGAAGCDEELATGAGHGCGRIELFAEGAPGCAPEACNEGSGTVAPSPLRALEILTRAPVDHKYNCKTKAQYDSEPWATDQPIAGCVQAASRPAYIDQLKSDVGTSGTPAGFRTFQSEGFDCTVEGGPTTVVTVPEGNWHVDCGTLSLKRPLIFLGGNVVFDGDIDIQGSGALTVNGLTGGSVDNDADGDGIYTLDITTSSLNAAFIYLRDGSIRRTGTSTTTPALNFIRTIAYFAESSTLENFAGADAPLAWTAPTEGAFEDLALWSDSTLGVDFAGSAGLVLEGAFFVPRATVTYTGGGAGDITAQFIADKLVAKGNGRMILKPTRGVPVPPRPTVATLIR